MIKINELRVGNYVKGIALGLNHKIDLHFFNECYDDDTMLDWYQPICLTHDILKNTEINIFDWFCEGSFMLVKDNADFDYGWAFKVRNANHTKEIEFGYFKYVHQLQNGYYFLTGEELNINL